MKCSYHQDRDAIGTCSRCGRGICDECNVPVDGKNTCKSCAGKMASQTQTCRKEPLLALILSFFLPGLGQIYNGNTNNGILLIAAAVLSWILTSVCIGIFLFIGIWIYAMYDAYITAEKINRGEISY